MYHLRCQLLISFPHSTASKATKTEADKDAEAVAKLRRRQRELKAKAAAAASKKRKRDADRDANFQPAADGIQLTDAEVVQKIVENLKVTIKEAKKILKKRRQADPNYVYQEADDIQTAKDLDADPTPKAVAADAQGLAGKGSSTTGPKSVSSRRGAVTRSRAKKQKLKS